MEARSPAWHVAYLCLERYVWRRLEAQQQSGFVPFTLSCANTQHRWLGEIIFVGRVNVSKYLEVALCCPVQYREAQQFSNLAAGMRNQKAAIDLCGSKPAPFQVGCCLELRW